MRYPIINAKKTGTNIYKFCRKKNITANGLRVYMNFACNQTIYRWFHGQSLPSLDNFYALSILLGVNVEDLLVNENGIITVPGKDGCLFMHRERVQIYHGCLGKEKDIENRCDQRSVHRQFVSM